MSDGLQLPASPPQLPGLPENFQPIVIDGFETLNTKPTRSAIGDQQLYWCNNWIPIGRSNLRTMYDVGDAIYAAPTGRSITYFNFGNIGDTPLCMVILDDGSIMQVNTATLASSPVAAAGTISSSTTQIGFSQWGSQFLLMSSPQPNGYFMWDGTVFYRAGTSGPLPTIGYGGAGYTYAPTITAYGGTGNAAMFSADIQNGSVNRITVTASGSGYSANDVIALAFSSGGVQGRTAIATAAINAAGNVTSITILSADQGLGYTAGVQVSFVGGGGFGAVAGAVARSGTGILSVAITSGGFGYTSPPTVIFTDTNNPVARATVAVMPFNVNGTAIETFTSRVWISNGHDPSTTTSQPKSRVLFSAPGEVADFSPANGGGSFISTDSFLRVGYHGLKQSNGFLYLIGDSSVNYLSGVETTGDPPITTFANLNVDPQVGSPWPQTVRVFSRAVVFGNSFGIHALYGGAVRKVSSPLDGIYATVSPDDFGNFEPSSGITTLFGIDAYVMLMPIIDTITGQRRNALLLWDGQNRWWTAGQSVDLTYICSQEIESTPVVYGTNGSGIYPLFQEPSTGIVKTFQSKWYDRPSYIIEKRTQRVSGLLRSDGLVDPSLTITVDSEKGSQTVQATPQFIAVWFNNVNSVVPWTTASGDAVTWIGRSQNFFMRAVDVPGVLQGATVSTRTADFTMNSLTLITQQYLYTG